MPNKTPTSPAYSKWGPFSQGLIALCLIVTAHSCKTSEEELPGVVCASECACDQTYSCDQHCACDPECGACLPACSSPCECDVTYSCDDNCSCDPECGTCLASCTGDSCSTPTPPTPPAGIPGPANVRAFFEDPDACARFPDRCIVQLEWDAMENVEYYAIYRDLRPGDSCTSACSDGSFPEVLHRTSPPPEGIRPGTIDFGAKDFGPETTVYYRVKAVFPQSELRIDGLEQDRTDFSAVASVTFPALCVPDCTGLVCGPDPICGHSCGRCPSGTKCTDAGQCGSLAGGPCTTDSDCASVISYGGTGPSPQRMEVPQICMSERTYGFPGGYCTMARCVENVRRDPCPSDFDCLVINRRGDSACMKECTGRQDCRTSWACNDDPAVCWPGCTPTSCPTGYSCGSEGVCVGDPGCRGQTSVTDTRDGNVYPLVEIGEQCWFQTNLKYQPSTSSSWRCYDNDPTSCDRHGRLYIAMSSDPCPSGFHVPTDDEWKMLESTVGMNPSHLNLSGWRGTTQGKQLLGAEYLGSDTVEFHGHLGGYARELAGFFEVGEAGYYWTSTQVDQTRWYRGIRRDRDQILRDRSSTRGDTHWYSVRCLLDR